MSTLRRMSIPEWKRLWKEDRPRWAGEMRDRPSRFDRKQWKRAVRNWSNEIPPDHVAAHSPAGEGEDPPFAGVPFLVKDLFDVTGEVTGCSSPVLTEAVQAKPARRDAELVRKLRTRGACPAGRTHMNEFAYGLDGKNAHTGDCPHPLDSSRISGGSSSGSAWAVAAGIVPLALGTDTGGSIRVPAALCGILGYRPAWNPDDTAGAFPLAPSFDTAGWFTADAGDMYTVLEELLPAFTAPRERSGDEKVFRYYLPPGVELEPQLSEAIELWKERIQGESRGMIRIEPLPRSWDDRIRDVMQESLDAYNVVGSSEAWNVHRDWLDPFREWYQPVVWSLIDRGRHWSEERRRESGVVVARMKEIILAVLEETSGGLIIPATPVATPRSEEVDSAFREETIRLNAPGSMAGVPVLSVPVHLDAIRSGGLQVLVPPEKEDRLAPVLQTLRENT
ncbi:MAG: amidase [Spirochaetaceae bacterium]|nr:MAG: amidase [Spirochaetaceae bacterium]